MINENSPAIVAARVLADCWTRGEKLAQLLAPVRPSTIAEGYAAQAALVGQLSDHVVGWKIAATSSNGQRHIGVDGPIAGRLFARRVLSDGATISMHGNAMCAAECEFVFRMAKPLIARRDGYARAEVIAAIGSLHPGLELPDSRFTQFANAGVAQLLADNACTHYMVIGDASDDAWRTTELDSHATMLSVDGVRVTQGSGADVLGDPLTALTWLVNELCRQAIDLNAGQWVTTGVTGQPSAIQAGNRVVADLGTFGSVTAQLTD